MVNLRGNTKGRGQSPRNFLARREQLRLLLLVASFGMVVVLMGFVANSDNWEWLFSLDSGSKKVAQANVEDERIDTRRRPIADESLPLDVFVAPTPRRAKVEDDGDYFAEVDIGLLSGVQDNSLLRRAEFGALLHLLDILNRNEQADLDAESIGDIGFAPLFKQPNTYRGKLVTVKGIIRRAFDLTPPKNEFGLDRYHQLWLQPADGPRTPIVVNVLELPDGFPSSRGADGEIVEIYEEVTITGFFYRNWAYTTDVQVLTAPWVLAKQIEWIRAPTPAERGIAKQSVSSSQAWLAIGGAAVIGISFALWVLASSNSKAIPTAAALVKHYHLESVESLAAQVDDENPSEALRQLAEHEQEIDAANQSAADQETSPTESHTDTNDDQHES